MNGWRAIIPLNLGRDCKTRLASHLSAQERETLVRSMAAHVVEQVRAARGIKEVFLLSPEEPEFETSGWFKDHGRGLNAELAAAISGERQLITHADLPLLRPADIEAMIEAAEIAGAAIAPDRFETGTNGLALLQCSGFRPAFGDGSFAKHQALLPNAVIIKCEGLGHDIDTFDDFDAAAPNLR